MGGRGNSNISWRSDGLILIWKENSTLPGLGGGGRCILDLDCLSLEEVHVEVKVRVADG